MSIDITLSKDDLKDLIERAKSALKNQGSDFKIKSNGLIYIKQINIFTIIIPIQLLF